MLTDLLRQRSNTERALSDFPWLWSVRQDWDFKLHKIKVDHRELQAKIWLDMFTHANNEVWVFLQSLSAQKVVRVDGGRLADEILYTSAGESWKPTALARFEYFEDLENLVQTYKVVTLKGNRLQELVEQIAT